MESNELYLRIIIALTVVAIMFWLNLAGIVVLAAIGATVTVALTTGAFKPVFPGVSRAHTPVQYWLLLSFFGFALIGGLVSIGIRIFLKA